MKKPILTAFLSLFVVVSLAVLHPPIACGQSKTTAYVGSDACKDCHEPYYASYVKTVHAKKAIPGSPAASQGCESCHGPGAAHVEQGGGKGAGDLIAFHRDEPPERKSATCLNCHGDDKGLFSWETGAHQTRGVSCTDCHTGHSGGRTHLKSREVDLCISCHKQVRNQISRQSRHPIQEGKVMCSSCHSPHGTFAKMMLRTDSKTELCFTCHQEKRGPFAFEHAPVTENCSICHQAHGSNHENLLARKMPQLCQACHNTGVGHTSRAYTVQHGFDGNATAQKNKFFAQGCVNCHGNVHGSNRSPQFLR